MAETAEDRLIRYYAEDKGPAILAITVSLTAVALCFIVARMYSRSLASRKLLIDDYLVIVSGLLSAANICIIAAAIHFGAGKHSIALEPEDRSRSTLLINIAFVPGVFSFVIPKFAVLILLSKILNPNPTHRRIMWVVSVTYALVATGLLVVNFTQCSPIATLWGKAEGTCWNRSVIVNYSLTVGILSALFDIYLAAYPTWVLFRLLMSWKKKLALSSSLGFGYCAGAITIYKCTSLPNLRRVQDFTYASDEIVIWTNIEANCVVIGSCIPTLYPLAKKLFGNRLLGDSMPGMNIRIPLSNSAFRRENNPLTFIGTLVARIRPFLKLKSLNSAEKSHSSALGPTASTGV